jgi:hypothetical protein
VKSISGVLIAVLLSAVVAVAQEPDLRQMSGIPLPANDLPAGTVSVRVVRGSLANNIAGQPVEFTIDGTRRTVATDATGRAQVSGLSATARVKAATVVDGVRLETQEVAVGPAAMRFMLVAVDREVALAPPVKGMVVFGPESRVIAQPSEDSVQIFYLLDIVNAARTRVDPGGPILIDLPREARGARIIAGSSPQASAKGTRVTVTAPFAPGTTSVQIGYELPQRRGALTVTQAFPVALPRVTVLMVRSGDSTLRSSQFDNTREVTEQGTRVIIGVGPGIPAGQSLRFEVAGLPYHSAWPRQVALGLAALIMMAGIWGAMTGPARRANARSSTAD